jgi:sterol desaturase/sphingolipid hydroxylase (fatty acid hydroxylase superfamily)
MSANLVKGMLFPAVLISEFLAFYNLINIGWHPGIALFVLTVVGFVVIALLEWLIPYRRDWCWWTDRQVFNDLIHGAALSTIGPRLGEMLFSSLAVSGAAAVAGLYEDGIWPVELPVWIQVLLVIIFADFLDWSKHWLYHHSPALWPIHVLHHNPERLHIAKAGRLHFLESTVRFLVISVPLTALGAPPVTLFWFAASQNFLGNLNHSNVDFLVPRWLNYLMATPQVHRLHHANDPDLGRSNLSSFTMIPDHLFGTFRDPVTHPYANVGIAEDPVPKNLFGQLAAPLMWPLLMRRHLRYSTTPVTTGE